MATPRASTSGSKSGNKSSSGRFKWPKAKEDDLAAMYKAKEYLYNPNADGYHDRPRKLRCIHAFARKLGIDYKHVLKRVTSFRTQFTREKNKVAKAKSGSAPYKQTKRKKQMMQILSFLDQYTSTRETRSSLPRKAKTKKAGDTLTRQIEEQQPSPPSHDDVDADDDYNPKDDDSQAGDASSSEAESDGGEESSEPDIDDLQKADLQAQRMGQHKDAEKDNAQREPVDLSVDHDNSQVYESGQDSTLDYDLDQVVRSIGNKPLSGLSDTISGEDANVTLDSSTDLHELNIRRDLISQQHRVPRVNLSPLPGRMVKYKSDESYETDRQDEDSSRQPEKTKKMSCGLSYTPSSKIEGSSSPKTTVDDEVRSPTPPANEDETQGSPSQSLLSGKKAGHTKKKKPVIQKQFNLRSRPTSPQVVTDLVSVVRSEDSTPKSDDKSRGSKTVKPSRRSKSPADLTTKTNSNNPQLIDPPKTASVSKQSSAASSAASTPTAKTVRKEGRLSLKKKKPEGKEPKDEAKKVTDKTDEHSQAGDDVIVVTTDEELIGPSQPTKKKKKKNILTVKIPPTKKGKGRGKGSSGKASQPGQSDTKTPEEQILQMQQQKLQMMSEMNEAFKEKQQRRDTVVSLWGQMQLQKMELIKDEEVCDQLMEHISHITNKALRGKWPEKEKATKETDVRSDSSETHPKNVVNDQPPTTGKITRKRKDSIQSATLSDDMNMSVGNTSVCQRTKQMGDESFSSQHSRPQQQVGPSEMMHQNPVAFYPGFMTSPQPLGPTRPHFEMMPHRPTLMNPHMQNLPRPTFPPFQPQIPVNPGWNMPSPSNQIYCHNYNQYASGSGNVESWQRQNQDQANVVQHPTQPQRAHDDMNISSHDTSMSSGGFHLQHQQLQEIQESTAAGNTRSSTPTNQVGLPTYQNIG